jgi:hypothetical protein
LLHHDVEADGVPDGVVDAQVVLFRLVVLEVVTSVFRIDGVLRIAKGRRRLPQRGVEIGIEVVMVEQGPEVALFEFLDALQRQARAAKEETVEDLFAVPPVGKREELSARPWPAPSFAALFFP